MAYEYFSRGPSQPRRFVGEPDPPPVGRVSDRIKEKDE
jgi:hypothetical protein